MSTAYAFTPESFAALQKAQFEQIAAFASTAWSGIEPLAAQSLAATRSLYALGKDTQDALAKTLEEQFSASSAFLNTTFEQIEKSSPAGTEAIVSASINTIKSALDTAAKSYDALTQASRQLTDYVETTVAANTPPKAPAKPKKA